MPNEEKALIPASALFNQEEDYAFDLEEVRDIVTRLADLMENELAPLVAEHDQLDYIAAETRKLRAAKRAEIRARTEEIINNAFDRKTPPEIQLTPGQPILLIWIPVFNQSGGKPDPITVDLARVVETNYRGKGDLLVDMFRLAEIPVETSRIQKPTRHMDESQKVIRFVVYSFNNVIYPLRGKPGF